MYLKVEFETIPILLVACLKTGAKNIEIFWSYSGHRLMRTNDKGRFFENVVFRKFKLKF